MNQIELSLILPCFNEAQTIQETLRSIHQYMQKKHSNTNYELIVVNDGSTDDTLSILQAAQSEIRPLKVMTYPKNKGRGYAIKLGISGSLGKKLIMLDADLSYDIEHVTEILQVFDQESPDVVVVSPYMKGGQTAGVPLLRLFISKSANWLLASFFSKELSTVTCVVRGYNGDMLRSTPLYEDGKELHLEILRKIYLQKGQIVEIPGRLKWKNPKARRKIKLSLLSSAKDHFFYALLMKPARYLFRFGFFLLLIGLYEALMMMLLVIKNYIPTEEPWSRNLWRALSTSFTYSPHTAVIAFACSIIAIQMLTFAAILEVLRMQQEEKMQHILGLYRDKK